MSSFFFFDYPGELEAGLPAGGGDACEREKDAANLETGQSFAGKRQGVFGEEAGSERRPLNPKMGLDNRCQRTMSGSSDPESGTGASPLPPPPYAGEGALELRGSLDCWACAVLVTLQNLLVGTLNLLLVALIFGIILFPSGVLLGFGFLCHSKFFNTQAQYCRGSHLRHGSKSGSP
uniref:Uncharacterized protein n=1 Tax=Sphaerodactylus townsendi TaxID=933632 RepID=A0ACB8EX03_9SAUR